jgi:transposase
MAVRKLEIIIPGRLWEKLEELEAKTNVRKEDIFLRVVVDIIEGVRCPKCGTVIKEFE